MCFWFILASKLAVGQVYHRNFGLHHCSNAPYASSSLTALIQPVARGQYEARYRVFCCPWKRSRFPTIAEIKAGTVSKTYEVFIYGGNILLNNFVKNVLKITTPYPRF